MDWLASGLGLLSLHMVANHNKWGWIVMAIGSVMCTYLNFKANMPGMALGSIFYIIIEFIGFIKASKNDRINEK